MRLSSPSAPWVQGVIREGVRLDFQGASPKGGPPPPETRMDRESMALVDAEVESLLSAGAISLAQPAECLLYQRVFLVDKKGGKKRPVLDCRRLNQFLLPPHFKLEGLQEVRNLVTSGCWMTKVDLKSAYLHVPMAREASPYLAFRWRDRDYLFRSLPFGLSTAPWIFTKVMRVVAEQLRSEGVRLVVYLDDLLFIGATPEEAAAHTARATQLLSELGFLISWPKCSLTPSQRIVFLGFEIDSVAMTISLPDERVSTLQRMVEAALGSPSRQWKAREIARLCGSLVSTRPAVRPAYLHLFWLNKDRDRALAGGSWAASALLSSAARSDLSWWAANLSSQASSPLLQEQATWTLTTDSSLSGWGATLQGGQGAYWEARGFWPAFPKKHINVLELTAGLKALEAFHSQVQGRSLKWRCDNTPTVFSVRKWKSRNAESLVVLRNLWRLCRSQGLTLQIEHTPGVSNLRADELSRAVDTEDWKVHPRLFHRACSLLRFSPTVDAFASAMNTQLPRFWSFRPEPGSLAVDAMVQDWRLERPWANPPFSLVGRTLRLLREQQATAAVCVPVWESQAWWPLLLNMLVRRPVLLPDREDTFLPGLGGSTIPMGRARWRAWVCLLSGDLRIRTGPSHGVPRMMR